MPLVSISEAARLVKKDRSYFHKAYIKTGKITVDRSEENKPKIDTAELLRLFGELDGTHTEENHSHTQVTHSEIEQLKEKVEGLEALADERLKRIEEKDEMLAEKTKEIEYQRERVQSLEARYDRLLEDKREKDGLAHQLIERLDKAEGEKKGFWGRVAAVFIG